MLLLASLAKTTTEILGGLNSLIQAGRSQHLRLGPSSHGGDTEVHPQDEICTNYSEYGFYMGREPVSSAAMGNIWRSRASTILVMSAVVCSIMSAASPAEAWHWARRFAEGPWGGAGGNYYTGSPRSLGMTCASCHTGQSRFPRRVSMRVITRRVQGSSLIPEDIFTAGYQPGALYKVSVELLGEHRGYEPANGQYQDPGGTPRKVSCPLPVTNRNVLTAEVMNESNVYADFDGNGAGRLRSDSNNQANSTTPAPRCYVAIAGCGGGSPEDPGSPSNGGPTMGNYRHMRLVDPNSSPPFGRYACTTCDAVASMYGADPTPTTNNFPVRTDHFFWTAPTAPPQAGSGRIRFYMAFLDGDGYGDVYDDDFAVFRRAVCPAGSGACSPTSPPWNYTSLPPSILPQTTPRAPPAPPTIIVMIMALAAGVTAMVSVMKRRPSSEGGSFGLSGKARDSGSVSAG